MIIDFNTWIPHKRETWTHRYARLKEAATFGVYQGRWDDNGPVIIERIVLSGTPVKIVMVSRFGDCGITDDLSSENVYHYRLGFDELTDYSETP